MWRLPGFGRRWLLEYRVVATGVGFCEGPVWTLDGRLVVVSISDGCLYEIADGEPKVLVRTGGGPNGMAEGEDGRLYVAQSGGSAAPGVQAVSGERVSYLARGLDAPNDICFGPYGRLYFTDPRGPATPDNRLPGRVFTLTPGGKPEMLLEGPAYTNGIAFDAADRLYVAETFRQRVLRYQMTGGALGEMEVFCTTAPGFPDGICFDDEGRLYVAATLSRELQVFDAKGDRLYTLACGERSMPTNCCFGGSDAGTLFVTDSMGQRVLAFDLDARGLPLHPFRKTAT